MTLRKKLQKQLPKLIQTKQLKKLLKQKKQGQKNLQRKLLKQKKHPRVTKKPQKNHDG